MTIDLNRLREERGYICAQDLAELVHDHDHPLTDATDRELEQAIDFAQVEGDGVLADAARYELDRRRERKLEEAGDALRRALGLMVGEGPINQDEQGGCVYCGGGTGGWGHAGPDPNDHSDDCPWLAGYLLLRAQRGDGPLDEEEARRVVEIDDQLSDVHESIGERVRFLRLDERKKEFVEVTEEAAPLDVERRRIIDKARKAARR